MLLATRNEHKKIEYQALFKKLKIKLLTLNDFSNPIDAPEEADSFAGNALQKARFYFNLFHIPVISDDSGLTIKNLRGFPGVKSKRWLQDSYASKIKLLLQMLDGKNSACALKTAIAFKNQDHEIVFEGILEGQLVAPDPNPLRQFGYDIGFYLPKQKKLLANLTIAEKNSISHRSQALLKFIN